MNSLFIAAIFTMLGAVGAIQIDQQIKHEQAMHKALDVPNCVKDVPERKRTKVAEL